MQTRTFVYLRSLMTIGNAVVQPAMFISSLSHGNICITGGGNMK